MNITTLAPAPVEPLALADAKDYLRVTHGGEDALIAELISGSRSRIERELGLAMVSRTLRVTFDGWPKPLQVERCLRLPIRPAASLVAVGVETDQGSVDLTSQFDLEAEGAARLVWRDGNLAIPGRAPDAVHIDYVAGFGPTVDDVPDELRHAVRMLTADAYSRRGEVRSGDQLSTDISAILAPWRRVRL